MAGKTMSVAEAWRWRFRVTKWANIGDEDALRRPWVLLNFNHWAGGAREGDRWATRGEALEELAALLAEPMHREALLTEERNAEWLNEHLEAHGEEGAA